MKAFENRRIRGAISIFLVIITIPTMLFAAVLVDGSRMASATDLPKTILRKERYRPPKT